jgi:hypothetical protein
MSAPPTLTLTELRKLADVILDYFSGDAAYWRPQFITSSTSGPLSVSFAFREPEPEYAAALLDALRDGLAEGYTSPDAQRAETLVSPPSGAAADAVVTFYPREQGGDSGIGYDIGFRDSDEVWWGWFNLNV